MILRLGTAMVLAAWLCGPAGAEENDVERLFMEGSAIQGNLDKPHVVYIVPWKEAPSEIRDPLQFRRSFMGEILAPVDRDRFYRSIGNPPRKDGKHRDSDLPSR